MNDGWKPILCLDFDGVIHQYESPWKDALTISDGATLGFFDWAEEAVKHFRLVVYSSRSAIPGGIRAMEAWLKEQAENHFGHEGEAKALVDQFEFCREKPPAFLTIDDRALTFIGNWKEYDPAELRRFKPWNRKGQP